jgi:predicted TIM-barrel fold metal-dependent hydrolase
LSYKLISADSHLNEVDATWERVQKKHGDKAPKIVWNRSEKEVGPYLVIEGFTPKPGGPTFAEDASHEYVGLVMGGLRQQEGIYWKEAHGGTFSGSGNAEKTVTGNMADFRRTFRFEDFPGPGMDPSARLKDMDKDNVEVEVLYPSHSRHFYELSAVDEPFFHDIAQSYNEWALEYASHAPNRLIAQPLISVLNPEQAAADIRSYAKRGVKGLIMASSLPHGISYGEERFDPIWAAAVECNVPLAMHTSTGRFKIPVYATQQAKNFAGTQGEIQTSLAEMIYGKVFDRFPALKVISAEFGIGWVNYVAQRFELFDPRLGLKLTPKEYFHNNVYFTFEDDRAGVLTTPQFGADNFLWASDYPHGATTWPDSQVIVDRQFEGVSDETKTTSSSCTA